MSKLSVHLVTWNGARYLPHCFASLRAQTFRDWDLFVLDNGSADDSVAVIARELEGFPVPAEFVRMTANTGFAAGHNMAIRRTTGAFVQLLNQDIVLAPEYFAHLVAVLDRIPDAGAAQGLLLHWAFDADARGGGERTRVIDSMGLRVFRNRRVVDLCAGAEWMDDGMLANAPFEVFGVSGALPMYRRAALLDVGEGVPERSEFFDASFGSYKEDVDLAFRLRLRGWRSFCVPAARAWHHRTVAMPHADTNTAVAANRRAMPPSIRYHSYRNHLAVILKNECTANVVRDWPWIAAYELRKIAYCVLHERDTLRAFRDLWREIPTIRGKRRTIMARKRIRPTELRRWFQ